MNTYSGIKEYLVKGSMVYTFLLTAAATGSPQAHAEEAYILGDVLTIPQLYMASGYSYFDIPENSAFKVEFQIDGSYGPEEFFPLTARFRLVGAEDIVFDSSDSFSTFADFKIIVPRMQVGGEYYWADLVVRFSGEYGVNLELWDYGLDDQDDDDDGIPDALDSHPYSLVSEVDPLGVTGLWLFRYEYTGPTTTWLGTFGAGTFSGSIDGSPCDFDNTPDYLLLNLSYDQSKQSYVISNGDAMAPIGVFDGGTMFFAAVYDYADGTRTTYQEFSALSSRLMDGDETWGWNDGNTVSCKAISRKLRAMRVSP